MATVGEKVNCVLWLAELKSVTAVRRRYQSHYGKAAPHRNTIENWMKKFKETGSVNDRPRSGRPSISLEAVTDVERAFDQSPKKSLRRASSELNIPVSSVHKILKMKLHRHAYKIQVVQMLWEEDFNSRLDFCQIMLSHIANLDNFLDELTFSDEATFHLSGKVNRHNCRIWGTEKPHEIWQHERASPKINVWCALRRSRIIGPFFFQETTINGDIYLTMLKTFLIPELQRFNILDKTIFQQDGAPCHYSLAVRQFLNDTFQNKWIGRCGPISWPPRSPDLTPLDYFLGGHVKTVFYASKPRSLEELRGRIERVIREINETQLENVFNEMRKRLAQCVEKDGGYVEC